MLVNNTGVANVGWYLDRTLDEVDQVMSVNLLAPMRLCRLLLPLMVERGRGQVVNLSSMAGARIRGGRRRSGRGPSPR